MARMFLFVCECGQMRNSGGTKRLKVFAQVAVLGLVSGAIAGCSSDVSRFGVGQQAGYAGASPDVTGSLGAMGRQAGQQMGQTAATQAYGMQNYATNAAGQAVQNYAGQAAQNYGGQAVQNYATNAAGQAVQNYGGQAASYASQATTYANQTSQQAYGAYNTAVQSANGHVTQAGNVVRAGQQALNAPQTAAPYQANGQLIATSQTPVALPEAKPLPVARPATTTAAVAAAPVVESKPLAAPAATLAAASAEAVKPATTSAAKTADVGDAAEDEPRKSGSGPQFRAPVRGRVIAGFGPKPGGTRNEGVNFAVPAGTSVRAAEDGVVAYSGNELKGYGNLVLVKHSDGYVTAYAHNSELTVKKGDKVRRGQIIAKAGQTGNVQSPQLHFEIRKGSTPVDPSSYVAGL